MARNGYDEFADYNQVHAQAQAMADVRDDALEQDRQRRVKEENLAAFDAAREQGRSGRSMITASAFDGDGMRRDYMGGRLVGEMPLDSQGAIAAEFMDLANRSAAAKRHNAQIESDSLNSAMMAARRNGGMLPQNAVDMLSRKLGLDGKTSAVFRAGYLDNGDFDIDIVTRGQDGGLQRRTKKISPLEQYNLMLGAPGVWGAEGQAVADGLYQRLRGTRGKSELAAPSTYGQNLSAYQDGQRTKQEMQAGIELLKLAKEFSGNGKGGGKGGEEALLKAVVGNKAFASILARGDRIYEDAAGNEVDNPYEEDGKTLRNDVRPKRDDEGNVMYREDPELAFQRIHKAWERVSAGGGAGGGGGGIGDAIMQVALSHLSPRPPSPEEAEIAQRQRQNALDDQRRADVMRGREQQLIHYIDENGTHKVGNGYVVGGRVYDGNGNEMSGVQLADRNGRPLRDEIDERLAQRAAARAQGGGGLAGTTAADVVSGGGGQPPAQEQEVRQNDDEDRKRLEAERERLLAAKEARAKSRNAARTAAKASGLMKSSGALSQETTDTNSNMNRIAETASAALRQTERNYDEMPMTPEERRANAISDLKRWRAANGRENEISDEEIERMADEELKKQM